jgi:hypothetical protein
LAQPQGFKTVPILAVTHDEPSAPAASQHAMQAGLSLAVCSQALAAASSQLGLPLQPGIEIIAVARTSA